MEGKQGHTDKVTAASLLIALGIIYGDIGTSPLYVLQAVIGSRQIDETLILGSVSCIFWTLVFQTTVKYVWLTLKADNQGEGGIFSLYALVRRYGRRLVIPTMIGAAALLADGIITPAISVTSAIEGLAMIPGLEDISVVPIVITLISCIFFFQRFGSQHVGRAYGPVMALWFVMLLVLGLSQIARYPAVLKALSPEYGYDLLVRYPGGFWLLGAIFLCTTGAEALYSDLGHCGRRNIRITWAFVKTCLMVNYAGQAAWLLHQDSVVMAGRNPFFEMMPGWFLLPGILVATAAAVIASQALISGSFTLINEAMNLNFWLRVRVKQPTETKGQIYIPSVNTLLWAGCIIMVLYFRSSLRMEAAYGLAITLAMLMTTLLLSLFLRYKLRWHPVAVWALLLVFGTIEIAFFIANLIKFREGGFIAVLAAGLFFGVMYVIYFGRKVNNRYTRFMDLDPVIPRITALSRDEEIPVLATHLIYLTKADRRHQVEERIVDSIFARRPKRAQVYWFVHINRTSQPYTLDYEVDELADDKVIKVTINIGFRIQPRTELFFKKIVADLVSARELNLPVRADGSTKYNSEPDFRFVVIEKFLSVENEFAPREGIMLNAYFFLKRLGQSDERAFGLDKSDVTIEQFPLVFHPVGALPLKRKSS